MLYSDKEFQNYATFVADNGVIVKWNKNNACCILPDTILSATYPNEVIMDALEQCFPSWHFCEYGNETVYRTEQHDKNVKSDVDYEENYGSQYILNEDGEETEKAVVCFTIYNPSSPEQIEEIISEMRAIQNNPEYVISETECNEFWISSNYFDDNIEVTKDMFSENDLE